MQHKKIPLTVNMIKIKGEKFAQDLHIVQPPKFSNESYHAFSIQNGLKQCNIHGKSDDAQMNGIEETLKQIMKKIKLYKLRDIYNMDETDLFYRMASDKTIATYQIEGSKKDKAHMTIAFIVYAFFYSSLSKTILYWKKNCRRTWILVWK